MIDLEQHTLAFLDVETTGLSPLSGHRVCEIAVARFRGGEMTDSFETLINPMWPISPGASRVNGITDDDVREAPRFREVADRVEELMEGAVIVCHNAPFDLSFIGNEFDRVGKQLECYEVIDTLDIARCFFYFGSNSLGNIADELKINTDGAHRAMADVLMTQAVFMAFMDDLVDNGLKQISELTRTWNPALFRSTPDQTPIPPHIEEVVAAGKELTISYVDGVGRETRRSITPQEVYSVRGSIYLVAHCHMRDEDRTFRLDRIVSIEAR